MKSRADRRLGDREGAQHARAANSWASLGQSLSRARSASAEYALVLRRSGPDQHALRAARQGQRRRRPAGREAVSDAGEPDAWSSRGRSRRRGEGRCCDEPASSRCAIAAIAALAGRRVPARRRLRASAAGRRRSRRRPRAWCRKGKVPVSNEILKIKLPQAGRSRRCRTACTCWCSRIIGCRRSRSSCSIPGAGGYYDPGRPAGPRRRSPRR